MCKQSTIVKYLVSKLFVCKESCNMAGSQSKVIMERIKIIVGDEIWMCEYL